MAGHTGSLYSYSLNNTSGITSTFGLEYEITAGAGKAFKGVGYSVPSDPGASGDFSFYSDSALGNLVLSLPRVTGSHGVTGLGGDYGTLYVTYTGNANSDHQVDSITARFQIAAVPEPATWAMMLIGFAGLGVAGYRKTKNSRAARPAV